MDFGKNIIFLCSFMLSTFVHADLSPWEDYQQRVEKNTKQASVKLTYEKARELILNEEVMKDSLIALVSREKSVKNNSESELIQSRSKQVSLPLPNGAMLAVSITKENLLPEKLANKYKSINVYRVMPDDYLSGGRLDTTPNGFHAMLQTRKGETLFIDPIGSLDTYTNKRHYVSYRKQDQRYNVKGASEETFSCGVKVDTALASSKMLSISRKQSLANRTVESLLTYKVAIAATGEYAEKNGGTVEGALAAIVTTINRVNQVYEYDLGIHLELVENNDLIIFTNAGSDPYNSRNQSGLIAQNQLTIDSIIGESNYDIGHLFTTKGGGLAEIASVCDSGRKAKGISGVSSPVNDGFNLDFVAHEMGHQLGATHTFNGIEGLCSGGTREGKTAFEPGSGSTIMSYAGYCGVDNIQSHSDAMLHIGSINQIRDFTSFDRGNRCGIRKQAQNSPPNVNAGDDYTIPANTPFMLSGTAEDSDGDRLVYAWEQIDSGERSLSNLDTGNNALFRAHMANSSRQRSFPPIRDILNHSSTKGEALPIQQRKLNFSLVVQDGFNAAQSDNVSIQVLRTGSRFALNLPRANYDRGESHKILWNVANTNQSPINCDAVNILLSTNGGYDFTTELAKNVPNTGEAWITIPADTALSRESRFKIACSNNVFFAVSYRNFKITEKGDGFSQFKDDADQLEPRIEDRTPGSISGNSGNPTIVSNQNTNNFNSAGGTLGLQMFFMLFSLTIMRERYSNLLVKRLGFL